MRIVLDLQGAQGESRFRGIGRYTLSLARAIVEQAGNHEVLLALSDLFPDSIEPIRGMFDRLLPQDRIRVWQAAGPVRAKDPANQWRRAAAMRMREAFLASLEPDVVHVPDMFGGYVDDLVASVPLAPAPYATTVSIHDVIPLLNDHAYLSPDPAYRRHYMAALSHARRADRLLAVSESSAREARDHVAEDPSTVVNTSEACDPMFKRVRIPKQAEHALRARHGLTRPFILHTGGGDARKNLDLLIRAYAGLPKTTREAHQLALVGRMLPSEVERLQRTADTLGLGVGDVRITGYVDDDELVALYNLCTLFVMPSLHEGFGLPALEAMACGAPVIGSNATSLPEVIGWDAGMFDPRDVPAMGAIMSRALVDAHFRSELIRRGGLQAERFSWAYSACGAINAFERASESRSKNQRGADRSKASDVAVQAILRAMRALPGKPSDTDLLRTARAIATNHPEPDAPRLLVDVSELVQRDSRSGIQRVVRSMVTHLPDQLPAGHRMELVYATTSRPGYRLVRRGSTTSGAAWETTADVVEPRPGDTFLGLDLKPEVVISKAGFYDELRRLGMRVCFVVYDLLPVHLPNRFPRETERRHAAWLQIVSEADAALCISRAVAAELQSWIGAAGSARKRPLNVGWFHLGSEIGFAGPSGGFPVGASDVLDRMSTCPTFLVVGTLEPRKGHMQTLDAFDLLWAIGTDVNLVLVGRRGWQVEGLISRILGHSELGRRLLWLEGIGDEFLDAIYRQSACLIAPSEAEGFGLPLVEAAQHATPIIARDIPVFREIAANDAFYFEGSDPICLVDAIRDWLKLFAEGRQPRSENIHFLTWEQSARQLADALFKRLNVESWTTHGPQGPWSGQPHLVEEPPRSSIKMRQAKTKQDFE